MEIAWITPKWPFPVTDGARVATSELIKNLSLRKMKVHLYAIIPKEESVDLAQAKRELGVDEITLVRRNTSSHIKKVFTILRHPLLPFTLAPYAERSITESLTTHLLRNKPKLIVYDGLHAAAWSFTPDSEVALNCAQAYRAHNVESDLWFRAANDSRNPLKRIGLALQGHLVRAVEARLVRRSDFIFPVSATDARTFEAYGSRAEVRVLPIGMQVSAKGVKPLVPETHRKLLFVGRLDWRPNREGLTWILKNVWPAVMASTSDLSLSIVGSGNDSWLLPFRNLPGIEVVGSVEHLGPHYEACTATIVPIFYGSGTRVKAIESSLYGRVCISTALGVEGIGLVAGETYFRAESAGDWIRALITLDPSQARVAGEGARDLVTDTFNPRRISEKFIHSVSRVGT